MRRGGAPRPAGTDGSDFAFRMTVDDRYKKAAQGRMQMRKLLAIQAAFLILRSISCLSALIGGPAQAASIASCVFGGCSAVIGTIGRRDHLVHGSIEPRSSTGLKSTKSHLLKYYMLFTGMSLLFSMAPIVTGQFFAKVWRRLCLCRNSRLRFSLLKWSSEWELVHSSNYVSLVVTSLQGLEVIGGALVHLVAISTAFSFSRLLAPTKRA